MPIHPSHQRRPVPLLESIFTKGGTPIVPVLLALGTAILLGVLSSLLYMKKNPCSRSFALTLALLPMISFGVILAVNGNLGTGIAVAGAFSLVRFRSVQGSAREILSVFLSVVLGMCLGVGYLGLAVLLFLLYAVMVLLLDAVHFGQTSVMRRELKICVPESLDYDGMFDDLLDANTKSWHLERVRTIEMGSVYQLSFYVTLPEDFKSRPLLDEIRTRNGNLPVALGRIAETNEM